MKEYQLAICPFSIIVICLIILFFLLGLSPKISKHPSLMNVRLWQCKKSFVNTKVRNDACDIVLCHSDVNVIRTKLIFKYKYDENCNINRNKARLIAQY